MRSRRQSGKVLYAYQEDGVLTAIRFQLGLLTHRREQCIHQFAFQTESKARNGASLFEELFVLLNFNGLYLHGHFVPCPTDV